MVPSTIASMYGGNVTVNSLNGQLNLGSQELFTDSSIRVWHLHFWPQRCSRHPPPAAGDIKYSKLPNRRRVQRRQGFLWIERW